MEYEVEINIAVEHWQLSYSWGIGDAVDSEVLPESQRHGPRFLNALDLKIRGTAAFNMPEHRTVPANIHMPEIAGPEPSTHDAERAKQFIGCGRVELKSSLSALCGLTRGGLLALHYTLSHTDKPKLYLLCRPIHEADDSTDQRFDLIRFSAL